VFQNISNHQAKLLQKGNFTKDRGFFQYQILLPNTFL